MRIQKGRKRAISEFKKRVLKKELINVGELAVEKSRATGEFRTFNLIRGDKDTELVERLEEAAKHLKGVKKDLAKLESN